MSYLDPEIYPPAALIDLDGVCFKNGTDLWLPGVIEKLHFLSEDNIRIIIFTSRPKGLWMNKFAAEGIPLFGIIQKPLACSYFMVDDRLIPDACAKSLKDLVW
jgi:hypothetical protein